jgi:hypothetical protein
MQKNNFYFKIINTGLWEIDKVTGKSLLQIIISDGTGGLDYIPTDNDIVEIIINFLEAELRNDLFKFSNGVFGKNSQRPSQFYQKYDLLHKALDIMKDKADKSSLNNKVDLGDVF